MSLRGQDKTIDEAFGTRRRIATYERVSSDNQRERSTILTQYEELKRRLQEEQDVTIVERYVDDGVSGATELRDRPDGSRLLQDARARRFDELWVYKLDRLGRDDIDPLVVRRDLLSYGVRVVSLKENIENPLQYGLQVLLAAEERRSFLERSRDGMARAAREGRYCGGIVPYGYQTEGPKGKARLVTDSRKVWGDWTSADVVREVFLKAGGERWSCYQIADWLNALAVPTHYAKDERLVEHKQKGKRAERTAGKWRPSAVRRVLTNPTYRGEYVYGKNPGKDANGQKRQRQLIIAPCEALVSGDLWDAAQQTLRDKRLRNFEEASFIHLLKGRVRCGICGLNCSGAKGRGKSWYRCNGKTGYRGKLDGRCPAKQLDGDSIEPQILDDITRWLCDPGDVLDELQAEREHATEQRQTGSERAGVESELVNLDAERERLVASLSKGTFTDEEVAPQMQRIREQKEVLRKRLVELDLVREPEPAKVDEDLREALRKVLDAGLTREQQQELVGLLVRQITVHTEADAEGKPMLRCVVEYNFPLPGSSSECIAPDHTGTGSAPKRARSSPGT